MVRLGMILRESDVFVHIERNDVFKSVFIPQVRVCALFFFLTTHVNLPSLTILIKALYVGIGDDPVGNPRTNGCSGVGANSLIL
jgi:hypothetical protein